MSKRELTRAQRAFLALYNPFFEKMLGWRQDAINEEFVRTYGVGELLKYGKTMGDTLSFLAERYGESEAQHIAGFSGMMNGCRFCGVGHNLTANVMIFQRTGELFPIDELEIPELQKTTDTNIMRLFQDRLSGTRWADLLRHLERMNQLRIGASRTDSDDDLYLGTALDLWIWNNECTIEVGLDIDATDVPSFATFNRNRPLYDRYRKARASAD